jgi:NitT/TauT family transport system permease protein
VARALSIIALVTLWAITATLVDSRMLPGPLMVAGLVATETLSGELPYEMGCTLARVIVSFSIALVLGSLAGYAMGHWRTVDRYGDPWLVALINLPALVTILFAYIWIGLNETAAILAVALNKLPSVVVMMREGTRALDPGLDEMARAFRLTGFSRARHVVMPQLVPYFAAASRSGLAIAWKIVLVAELIGRPNGVGFVLGTAFSLFDLTRILSYALSFVAIMLTIENLLVQPLERRAQRWRRRA